MNQARFLNEAGMKRLLTTIKAKAESSGHVAHAVSAKLGNRGGVRELDFGDGSDDKIEAAFSPHAVFYPFFLEISSDATPP
jgi:hypothetical protein